MNHAIVAIILISVVFPLSAYIYKLLVGNTLVFRVTIAPLSMLGASLGGVFAAYTFAPFGVFVLTLILAVILNIIGLIIAQKTATKYFNHQIENIWKKELSKQRDTYELADFFIEIDTKTAKLERRENEVQHIKEELATLTLEIEEKITIAVERFRQQTAVVNNILYMNTGVIKLLKENMDKAEDIAGTAKRSAVKIDINNKNVQKSVQTLNTIINKIKVIDDISFQTNILALNAAIEAAKAGEYGKEFAVVAASIQKLSEKSKKSAAEIDKISKSGILMSERTGRISAQIVPDIKTTAKQIEKIAQSTKKQHIESQALSYTIAHLDEEIQHFTETTNEISQMIKDLYKIVRKTDFSTMTEDFKERDVKDHNLFSDYEFVNEENTQKSDTETDNNFFSDDEFSDAETHSENNDNDDTLNEDPIK